MTGIMQKTYRNYDPDQAFLLPPNPREWLPPDHVVFFIEDVVDQLDLSAFYDAHEQELRGQPPYEPRLMVKLHFYAYTQGVFSSRELEKDTYEDIPFRVLAAGNHPDHSTHSRFRKTHLQNLAALFTQMLQLCVANGLVDGRHVSVDGTKIRANASRHKAMSYDRMVKDEARLRKEIEEHLKKAAEVDEDEDARETPKPNRMPPELARKEERLKRIQEGLKLLRERKRTEAGQEVEPEPKEQVNFTDPDSRIMPMSSNKKAFEQAYNAQLAVDSKAQVIVAHDVVNTPVDVRQLPSMMDRVEQHLGKPPTKASADAGYFSEANLLDLTERGVDAYIPPDRQKHGVEVPPAPRGRIPKDLGVKDRMRRKLRTQKGRKEYAHRKVVVEPVFGLVKRVLGFRRFNLRGQQHAKDEWAFVAAVYNAMRMYWSGKTRLKPAG